MKWVKQFAEMPNKRRIILLAAVAFTAILIVLLVWLRPFSNKHSNDPLRLIPNNAFLVIRVNHAQSILQPSEPVPVIKALERFSSIELFFSGLRQADSLLQKTTSLQDWLKNASVFISLHPEGSGNISPLVIVKSNNEASIHDLHREIDNSGSGIQANESSEGTIYTSDLSSWSFAAADHLLLCSPSQNLIEKSLSGAGSSLSIGSSDAFRQALESASEKSTANILFNSPMLYRQLGMLLSEETYASVSFLETMASWVSADVIVEGHIMRVSGVIPDVGSDKSVLSVFDNPASNAGTNILSLLPEGATSTFFMGGAHFDAFFAKYQQRLLTDRKAPYNHENETALLTETLGTEIHPLFFRHIKELMGVFSYGNGANPDVFGVLPIVESADFREAFKLQAEEMEWDTSFFKGSLIIDIPAEYMAYSLFGPIMQPITTTAIAITDKCVYLGTSSAKLKNMLEEIYAGRTLLNSDAGKDISNNVTENWNAFAWLNLNSTSKPLTERWLGDSSTEMQILQAGDQSLGFCISLGINSNGAVFSGMLRCGDEAQKSSDKWYFTVDDALKEKPVIISGGGADEYYAVAVDQFNNVYLIANGGRLLWKQSIDEDVLGGFSWLQTSDAASGLAFTSEKALWFIQKNGENKHGYPVTIREGIVSSLLVADYEKNRNYRLLLCTNEGDFLNFNSSGQPTTGWVHPSTGLTGPCKVLYSRLKDKDYLLLHYATSQLFIYDRKGNQLGRVDDVLFKSNLNTVQVSSASQTWVAMGTDGKLIRIKIDGTKTPVGGINHAESACLLSAGNILVLLNDGVLSKVSESGEAIPLGIKNNEHVIMARTGIVNKKQLLMYITDEGNLFVTDAGHQFEILAEMQVSTNADVFCVNNKIYVMQIEDNTFSVLELGLDKSSGKTED